MITQKELSALLVTTEKAHAASGHAADGWADWYAQYMLPRLTDLVEQSQEIKAKNMQFGASEDSRDYWWPR